MMRHWDRAETVDEPFVERPSRIGYATARDAPTEFSSIREFSTARSVDMRQMKDMAEPARRGR